MHSNPITPPASNPLLTWLFSPSWRGKSYLLSPFLDFMMMGGGALIAAGLILYFVPHTNYNVTDIESAAILFGTVSILSYIVNYPHFMMSYQIFYSGFKEKLTRFQATPAIYWRYLISGIFIPAGLLVSLSYGTYVTIHSGSLVWASYALAIMYFFVGWHYMKQAFGVFMVTSALNRIYYKNWQRKVFLINSYVVWIWSWVYIAFTPAMYVAGEKIQFFRELEPYTPSWIPYAVAAAVGAIAILTSLASAATLLFAWIKEGKTPSFIALLGYCSMYYLFALVAWVHPLWIMAAPFFHSLQYYLFVFAYKKGHYRKQVHTISKSERTAKAQMRKIRSKFEVFFGLSFLLGALFFSVIPMSLDAYLHLNLSGVFPAAYCIAMFSIFINVHHYFIDNVIWRKEHSDVGDYLFHWSR